MLALLLGLALGGDRIQISVGDATDVDVIPAGKHGVVLFVQRKGDKKAYEINGYDTDFQPTWSTVQDFGKQQAETAKDADADHAWMLLQRGYQASVLKTRLEDGETHAVPVELGIKAWTDSIRTDGTGGAWIAGQRGKHGALSWVGADDSSIAVDLGKKRLVSGISRGVDGHVQAAIRDWKIKPGSPFTVLDLKDGAVARTFQITPDEDVYLLTGRALPTAGQGIIAGTWQPRSWIPGAQGMYLSGYDDNGQTWFSKFAFSEMDNHLAFLGDKREERVEKRVEKKKDKGKEVKIRWNLLIHDPVQTAEGLVLIAEAYYPVYHTYTRTVVVSNGQGGTTTTTQTYTVFVGWAFSHALVMGFDNQGQRLWDHSFPLQTGLSSTLREHVRMLDDNGRISIVYAHRNRLNRAVIEGNKLVLEADALTTEDTGGGDEVRKNIVGDAAWWYDDVFLLYGIDKVKEEGEKKERVFFFSKLERQPEVPADESESIDTP